MPRNKKGANGGSRGRGKLRGQHLQHAQHQRNGYSEDDDDVDFIPFSAAPRQSARNSNAFSLASEARRTPARHQWSTDTKLRNSKISFVSSGDIQPLKLNEDEEAVPETAEELADMTLADVQPSTDSTHSTSIQQDTPADTEDDDRVDAFVIDTVGSEQPVATPFSAPQIRASSPTPSNSSEDVVIFSGRDNNGRGLRRASPPRRAPSRQTISDPYESKIRDIDQQIHDKEKQLAATVEDDMMDVTAVELDPNSISIDEFRQVLQGVDSSQTNKPIQTDRPETIVVEIADDRVTDTQIGRQPSAQRGSRDQSIHKARFADLRKTRREQKEAEEEALINDYIANMEDEELMQMKNFNARDLGGEDDDVWEETDASAMEQPKSSKTGDWTRDELEDFDDLSTSDGIMENVQAILSKRERQNGVQYLVVWDDQSVDEARWHYHTSLPQDPATVTVVEEFEAEELLIAEFQGEGMDSDEYSDEDGSEDELDGTDGHGTGESDDMDDDADLIQRNIDRMTDEKIARLLAKQEELGLGSDELVLFDGMDEESDGLEDLTAFFTPVRARKQRGRGGNKEKKILGPNTATGHFPKATALADAYDGFDVMDFERPSLKKKPKGRKGKLILDDISDSELEESMQMAWENDRMKKKQRKEEREELRAAGLLGKKNQGKPDLSARYGEGMGIAAIKGEIRDFLQGGNTTLSLPPMDKTDRKIVHEIAATFNLKSKSAGVGKKRFPVLYRTQRTLVYRESMFDLVETKIDRKFFPRMDIKGKKTSTAGRAGRGGGFSKAAVGYRDGDVVGATAPEIGSENRGRKMLEMMGWSSGDALGALNNKGILTPVSHVVKTSKAGLG